jgi:hypothetical protein
MGWKPSSPGPTRAPNVRLDWPHSVRRHVREGGVEVVPPQSTPGGRGDRGAWRRPGASGGLMAVGAWGRTY